MTAGALTPRKVAKEMADGFENGTPMSGIASAAARIGLLLTVPALIAWVTGCPFIFPSLGPSAFSLIVGDKCEDTGRKVIGGHLIGVAGGLLSYHLIAHGLSLSALPAPLSPPLLRLGASGVLSVVLTAVGMLAARAEHPPACATTLIVSLGVLSTFGDAFFIMLAVAAMYATYRMLPGGPRPAGAGGDSGKSRQAKK